jgi:DNA repair protein RadC
MQCMNFILEILHVGWRSKLALKQHRHFHPSGNLTPSKEDTVLTDRMLKLSELIGIPLIDHIIVGGNNKEYFSFKSKGALKNSLVILNTNYKTLNFPSAEMVADRGKSR